MLLAVLFALVAVLAARPGGSLADLDPPRAIMSEGGAGLPAPADRLQPDLQSELVLATSPAASGGLLPPRQPPRLAPVSGRGGGGLHPGHRHRVERPPRLAS